MFEKIKNSKLFSNFKFQISNLLEVGFYLFIFLLPWQTHLILRAGEWHGKFGGSWPVDYWRIALYGVDILLVLLLAMAAVYRLKIKSEKLKVALAWIFVSVLDLVLFVSIFFAQDKALAIYKYTSFLLGVGLFWLASGKLYDRGKAVFSFLASVSVQAVFSLWQFFFQGSPACKWLGLSSHSAADGGASVIETVGADGKIERWLRSYGSFDHPNALGGFLALGLLFSFFFLLRHKRDSSERIDKIFMFYLLSFIFSLAGLLLTFSRSSLLAAAVGMIFLAVSSVCRRNRPEMARFFKLSLLAMAVAATMVFSYADVFLARTSYQARLEVKSITERQLYFQDSLGLIRQNWMFGVGVGNYTKALEKVVPDRFYWQWQPVHNAFLLILAEGGVFSLAAYCLFLIYLFYLSLRKKDVFNLSILLSLGIMMILDHYLWSLHSGQLLFWLMAGMIMNDSQNNKEYDDKSA